MATKRRLLGGRAVRPLGGRAVRPIGGRPVVITGAASGIGLVGPDAYVFDALARVAPTHYYDVMAVLEKRLRAGAR